MRWINIILTSRYFPLIPAGIALVLAFRTTGRKKGAAWGIFICMALSLGILYLDDTVLMARGLAWRDWVMACAIEVFLLGEMALLIWAGIYLWKHAPSRQAVSWLYRTVILAGTCFLCLVLLYIGLLIFTFGAGGERVVERGGEKVLESDIWLDDKKNYYAYYGPFVRGKRPL